MNHFVTLLVLLLALCFAIDVGFARIAIDRIAQSEGYTVMTVTDAPIRF